MSNMQGLCLLNQVLYLVTNQLSKVNACLKLTTEEY